MTPTPTPLTEAAERVAALASNYEELATRFRRYHETALSVGDASVWDARADEEARNAADLRSLLAQVAALAEERGRLAWALEAEETVEVVAVVIRDELEAAQTGPKPLRISGRVENLKIARAVITALLERAREGTK